MFGQPNSSGRRSSVASRSTLIGWCYGYATLPHRTARSNCYESATLRLRATPLEGQIVKEEARRPRKAS
jgi:hypothetical protein